MDVCPWQHATRQAPLLSQADAHGNSLQPAPGQRSPALPRLPSAALDKRCHRMQGCISARRVPAASPQQRPQVAPAGQLHNNEQLAPLHPGLAVGHQVGVLHRRHEAGGRGVGCACACV